MGALLIPDSSGTGFMGHPENTGTVVSKKRRYENISNK